MTPAQSSSTYPQPGELMLDFGLPSSEGRRIRVSDFRGDRNLVLAFVGSLDCPDCRALLKALADHHLDLLRDEAQALAIVWADEGAARRIKQQAKMPFPVLADRDGRVHRRVGALAADDEPGHALYITDRYNQVYMAGRQADGDDLPGIASVLARLDYIEIQCPE